jgi:hypothetical protein
MKFNIILVSLLIGCFRPEVTTTEAKKELELKVPAKTPCEQKLDVITNLASACYLEIQNGCIKDNEKGRQKGDCPTCDGLDSAQEAYNKICAS